MARAARARVAEEATGMEDPVAVAMERAARARAAVGTASGRLEAAGTAPAAVAQEAAGSAAKD